MNDAENGGADDFVLFRFPLARFPSFGVGAGQKVKPHVGARQNRMVAHATDKRLQLEPPSLNKLLLVAARNLLVGQRRDGNDAKFLNQPFVQPVKVFVTSRHLDVVDGWRQLIGNEALQSYPTIETEKREM